MQETPKTSFAKSVESPLTSAIPTTSTQEDESSKLRRKGIVKWLDSSKMSYGFITMDGKVVFFQVNNVRKGEDYALKPGDEVTFILDEYNKGVIDVKYLPTLRPFSHRPLTFQ
ncbi:MAG: cold shock domain-containing protein [Gammaproteobacteria bacterium]|nr:cold shock domain-containing protein [Gammaproteobacteria bacterium]